MSLELLMLLVFVGGASLSLLTGERIAAVVGGVAGIIWILIKLVHLV